MKNISRLILLAFAVTSLGSCADKMTDRHSAMLGGREGVTRKIAHETPSNTDGMGRPLAGGNVNSTPDSMWNQSSPLEAKPF
jgi:hypothetical protein